MRTNRTQCNPSVILRRAYAKGSVWAGRRGAHPHRSFATLRMTAAALLLASSVSAQVLFITSGGHRAFDREPDTAETNCLGWTYGASPAVGDHGELVGMYVASDALTQHCRTGIGIDSALRFGDAIRFHAQRADGSWTPGVNVIDRAALDWMIDTTFLQQNLQTYAGHVASPSVVRRDGRWYMAFAMSRDDHNLCAGEHYASNPCGSCTDPWSYFVLVWAVSDDGINWRLRERVPGDPTFLGRPPTAAERTTTSSFKGLTRVSLVPQGGYFYIAAQYWARSAFKVAMFRVAYDPLGEWGTAGDPEAWSVRRRAWIGMADYLDDPLEPSLFVFPNTLGSIVRTGSGFTVFNAASNRIYYQTSQNLVEWTPAILLRSSIPFFADGFGYETSVIDPVAEQGADGKLHLFFASADGDPEHGIARDGRHDCGLYSGFGPTAVYLGTGIYEAIVEPRTLRLTAVSLQARGGGRFDVRVRAFDGTTPAGNVVVADGNSPFRIIPLVSGAATVELPLTTPGDHSIYAWFDAQGDWDASRSPVILLRGRHRAAR